MIIEPNKNYKEPFEYLVTGFASERRRLPKKELKIIKVLENSPANEAGLLSQNEITAINRRTMFSHTEFSLAGQMILQFRQIMMETVNQT
jgi:predicted metalloprotease with PDZ domain